MPLRVLIVEDELITAADLRAKVTRMGYEVVGGAVSGEEAIALADQLRPQIVLMDIQLQGAMDGIETARAIRGIFNVCIIFITANASLLSQRMPDPASTCLSKPFSQRQLEAALNAATRVPGGNTRGSASQQT